MRNFKYFMVFATILLVSLQAASASSFTEGYEAYDKEDYTTASEKFEEAIAQNPNNVSAYYNLGISKMENKKYGEAIWALEKVLKFSPNDAEAKEKIENCYSKLSTTGDWSPRLNTIESGLYNWSSDNWSFLTIAFSVLIFLIVLSYKRIKIHSLKRLLFVSGILSGFFMISSGFIAFQAQKYQDQSEYAIVTKRTIPTFIDEKTTAQVTLQEGVRVHLVDKTSTEIVRIKTPNGEEHLVQLLDLSFI